MFGASVKVLHRYWYPRCSYFSVIAIIGGAAFKIRQPFWNHEQVLPPPLCFQKNLRNSNNANNLLSDVGNQLLFANNRNRVRWTILCLSQDGACIDLFENHSENSLKPDLSNDTIVSPPLFSLVNAFKYFLQRRHWAGLVCYKKGRAGGGGAWWKQADLAH